MAKQELDYAIDQGGAAFPTDRWYGLSRREWFAGQALAGIIANSGVADPNAGAVARLCFKIADAMLVQADKEV